MGRKFVAIKQEKKRTTTVPVCIAGMHRSGTSMVAQLLHRCGLYLGHDEDILGPSSDNQDGFWENVRFVHINDGILGKFGGAWDFPPILKNGWEKGHTIRPLMEAANKLIDTFQGKEPWGWKDPRNSLTAPFWEQLLGRENIKYIICLRNPLEVARSIYKRNFNSFAFSFHLWLAYHKAIMSHTRPGQRLITHYETYFFDPAQELKRLITFLNLNVPDAITERACSKISRNLRHHSQNQEDLIKAGASAELIDLYGKCSAQAGPVFLQAKTVRISARDTTSPPAETLVAPSSLHETVKRVSPAEIRKGMVSIIILTYNQLRYTEECIRSLQKFTPESHEIIFVDNGSTDGTIQWLQNLLAKNPHYHLIENQSNLGFARGCNQGIKAASGEYLLLLNNDVVVTDHWLAGMLELIQSDETIGIVGPMTNNISGIQKDPFATYQAIKDLPAYAKAFREEHRHRRIPLRRIVGFCMLFKRSLLEKVGWLDENFGTGNFEDDDYCLRATLEGHQNFIAGDVFIHHYGSRTFIGNKIDYSATMGGHRKVFSGKWNSIPRDSDLGKKLLVLSLIENAVELCSGGESDRAVTVCIEGIGQFPDEPVIYQTLADLLLMEKSYQESLEALAAMPEQGQEELRTYLLKGYCKEGLGLEDDAEVYADKVLALSPKQAGAMNLKGILAYKRGDSNKAEEWFYRAIKNDPGYGEPYTNLGVMQWAEGQKEEGLSLLEKGFILSPKVMDCATLYHTALIEMEAFARGEKNFRNAGTLYPQNQRIAFLLIDLLLKQGKDHEAMEVIEKAMSVLVLSEGLLKAALTVRDNIGPMSIKANNVRSLSVSMIVKNEEKHIAKCLMSVKPVADEIIVVDTGSTDRTRDIAKALGARVFDFDWKGDFSAARNHSLSQAKGNWIFSLDADEVISAVDYPVIRNIVGNSKPAAYKIETRNYSNQVGAQGFTANHGEYPLVETGLGWFPSGKVRLFPNGKGITFENPVHEFVEGSVMKAGLPVILSRIPVHHYGRLDEVKLREKGEAYYLLGKKKLEEKGSTDLKALFELGVQAGELKKYDEAAVLFERLVKLSPLYPLAQFNLGFAYLELGRFAEAFPYVRKGFELNPEKKECAINLAHCQIVVGDNLQAITLLEDIIQRHGDYPPAQALLAVAYAVFRNPLCYQLLDNLKGKRFDCSHFLHETAEALSKMSRFEQALGVFELIVKSNHLRDNTKALLEQCYRAGGEQLATLADTGYLKGLNPYDQQLTSQNIDAQIHRSFVGGLWDEVGRLQFEFLKHQGLKPDHYLVDVGCGALRGGIHFIPYLNDGHYCGLDMNASLIEAGKRELRTAGIVDKKPNLLVNETFEINRFKIPFDFAIAVSVFTHLPMNHIIRCLVEMKEALNTDGVFYATFFQAPESAYTGNIKHNPGGVKTHYDSDPFHYSFDEMAYMASIAGLKVRLVGDWNHPRDQKMLAFTMKNNEESAFHAPFLTTNNYFPKRNIHP
jgi:GT2 family glycosyltransferase/tetratricopeptide (TPR) repeat protein